MSSSLARRVCKIKEFVKGVKAVDEYIRVRLKAITSGMPTDDKISIMHDIYDELEEFGYSTRKIKDMIDGVIRGNIFKLKQQLDYELGNIKDSYRQLIQVNS
jgi:hypothetical protein